MVLIAPLVARDGGLAAGDQAPEVHSDAGTSDHLTVVSPSARFALYKDHVRII